MKIESTIYFAIVPDEKGGVRMGMTDSQWKDFLEAFKEDIEELNEYKEEGEEERYQKKYEKLMERIDKALKR